MTKHEIARDWYENLHKYADDLYAGITPGRYTWENTLRLVDLALEIKNLALEKKSTIVVHNYLWPEFHELVSHPAFQELGSKVGDSLGLSLYVRDRLSPRVDFESVYFMGATAKIITGDQARVYVPDYPQVLGCSLVFGTDYRWIEKWKERNPGGVIVTYVNSDAYLKSISDYVSTSRNTAAILKHAVASNPGKKVLFVPDKYLGVVMRAMAGLSDREVEIYDYAFGGFNAACYVHEKVNPEALEQSLDEHPDAELLIHPECGCASVCLYKIQQGEIPNQKAYFLSTERMVWRAKESPAKEFIVATEMGMVYRLRREVPDKKFYPVSGLFVCDYMKANSFEKLCRSLKEDRLEIVFCDDCCDPKHPYQDDRVIHIQRNVAVRAKRAIDRMMEIQD